MNKKTRSPRKMYRSLLPLITAFSGSLLHAEVYNVLGGSSLSNLMYLNGIVAENNLSNALHSLLNDSNITISGSIELNSNLQIMSMNLYQIGSLTTNIDNSPNNSITINGLSWTYTWGAINSSGFEGPSLIQTSGFAYCEGANLVCTNLADAINGSDGFTNGADRSNSPFSFDGRQGTNAERIRIWNAEQEGQVTNTPAAQAGIQLIGTEYLAGTDGILKFALTSWGHLTIGSTNNQFNSIYAAEMSLIISCVPSGGYYDPYGYYVPGNLCESSPLIPAPVPVPAAAWLLGTALISLAGFSRRKNIHLEI